MIIVLPESSFMLIIVAIISDILVLLKAADTDNSGTLTSHEINVTYDLLDKSMHHDSEMKLFAKGIAEKKVVLTHHISVVQLLVRSMLRILLSNPMR